MTNPLLHAHVWGDWSPWTEVPGTGLRYRMHGCTVRGCCVIAMDAEPGYVAVKDIESRDDDDPLPSDAHCGDELMEAGWEEGFTCTLPANHPGRVHRAASNVNEALVGVHRDGRPYHYAQEWTYDQ